MLGCGAHVRIIALPHVRCACGSACGKVFGTVRAMCVRVAGFGVCDVQSHFCTLFWTKGQDLERLFLFLNVLFLVWNILSCFRTAYSDLEHPKICWKNVNCKQREKIPLESILGQMFWEYFWPMYLPTTYPHQIILPTHTQFINEHFLTIL